MYIWRGICNGLIGVIGIVNVVFHVLVHDDIPKWWYNWWFHGWLVELYGMIRQIEFGGVFDGGDL